MKAIPEAGFSRLSEIIGHPKKGEPGYFPMSASTWWRGVREGRYPKGVKLSPGTTAWHNPELRKLSDDIAAGRVK